MNNNQATLASAAAGLLQWAHPIPWERLGGGRVGECGWVCSGVFALVGAGARQCACVYGFVRACARALVYVCMHVCLYVGRQLTGEEVGNQVGR